MPREKINPARDALELMGVCMTGQPTNGLSPCLETPPNVPAGPTRRVRDSECQVVKRVKYYGHSRPEICQILLQHRILGFRDSVSSIRTPDSVALYVTIRHSRPKHTFKFSLNPTTHNRRWGGGHSLQLMADSCGKFHVSPTPPPPAVAYFSLLC